MNKNLLAIGIAKKLVIRIILIEGENYMYEKKPNIIKSPDLTKMQEVIIDLRTRIYIAVGADPEEAKQRYLSRFDFKKL